MSVDMTIVQSAQGGGLSKLVSTVVSGDSSYGLVTQVAESQADQLLAIALDVSGIKGLYFHCDQDIIIKTNNLGAPDDTITLVADEVLEWHKFASGTEYNSNPLGTDVTEMHLVTGDLSGATANLTIIVVQDATE